MFNSLHISSSLYVLSDDQPGCPQQQTGICWLVLQTVHVRYRKREKTTHTVEEKSGWLEATTYRNGCKFIQVS